VTGELVGYGLSLLGVLFLVFFVPIALVVVVVTLLQRRGGSLTAPMEQWRRCNECKRRWWAVEGTDASRAKVLRRRRARRKARRRGKDTPEWARAQGWSRCPSCLSHDVRPSGQAEAQVSRGG
jgi:hypothetical protein